VAPAGTSNSTIRRHTARLTGNTPAIIRRADRNSEDSLSLSQNKGAWVSCANSGQLRRDERYRQNTPLKWVKFGRRLTTSATHRRPRVQRVHYLASVNNAVVLRARWVELHQAYLESSKPSDTRTKAFASEDDYRLPFQSLQFDLRGVATSTSDLTIFACGSNWSVASSESGFNAAAWEIV